MWIVPLDSDGMSAIFPDGWKVALSLHTVLFAKSTSVLKESHEKCVADVVVLDCFML
jgi:hypothetical protein